MAAGHQFVFFCGSILQQLIFMIFTISMCAIFCTPVPLLRLSILDFQRTLEYRFFLGIYAKINVKKDSLFSD